MKNLFFSMFALMLVGQANICFARERVVTINDLPTEAQNMLSTHFKNNEVLLIKKDQGLHKSEYEVSLNNGCKIDFNHKGEWKDIECSKSAVPESSIPQPIVEYIKKTYPTSGIEQIEKKTFGYEVELNNGVDLRFNSKYALVEIDED